MPEREACPGAQAAISPCKAILEMDSHRSFSTGGGNDEPNAGSSEQCKNVLNQSMFGMESDGVLQDIEEKKIGRGRGVSFSFYSYAKNDSELMSRGRSCAKIDCSQ